MIQLYNFLTEDWHEKRYSRNNEELGVGADRIRGKRLSGKADSAWDRRDSTDNRGEVRHYRGGQLHKISRPVTTKNGNLGRKTEIVRDMDSHLTTRGYRTSVGSRPSINSRNIWKKIQKQERQYIDLLKFYNDSCGPKDTPISTEAEFDEAVINGTLSFEPLLNCLKIMAPVVRKDYDRRLSYDINLDELSLSSEVDLEYQSILDILSKIPDYYKSNYEEVIKNFLGFKRLVIKTAELLKNPENRWLVDKKEFNTTQNNVLELIDNKIRILNNPSYFIKRLDEIEEKYSESELESSEIYNFAKSIKKCCEGLKNNLINYFTTLKNWTERRGFKKKSQ